MSKINKKNKIVLIGLIVFMLCADKANAVGVLTVDAGVLPTSRLYLLDRFDEWMQKNVFTFGVPTFRAEAALENVAERVAELQFLNAQGMLSEKLSKLLLTDWEENMSFAVRLTGEEFALGRRPVLLTDGIVKGVLASTDAIQTEFNENLIAGEQTIFLPDDLLSRVEGRIFNNIFSETAVVPDNILRLVLDDVKIDTENILKKNQAQIANEEKDQIVRMGVIQLFDLAEKDIEEAKAFYDNNNFRNALDNLLEARKALRLGMNNDLAIEPMMITNEEELKNKLDEIEIVLFESGLVDVTDIEAERARVFATYGE